MNRQSTISNSGDWLFRSIKRNPEGLLLVAAGAALLMRTAGSSKSQPVGNRNSDSAGDAMSDMATQTSDKASELASSASEFASQASERARNAARAASDKATDMARQTTSSAQGYASRMLEEQPLVVAVAGLAAGAALAAAFPSTQMEQETLGPIGEQVSDAAQRVGGQLKDATAAAGETLKNAARERGLSQDGLKEVASQAADAFSSRMSGRDDASDASNTSGKQEVPATTDPRF
ncbi:hypothetical protein [Rhodoplanes sp. Z2-YC6860]|uniref:hypothetical protein n=1 Tax=Rhodoplanes sp. Z2-YC6860 TaxID=674703 RepID=UPI00078EE733|nr:hypothetical protein [Rhodoplanes sp. Z2-YC6860]AMN41582.1 hypothetical protein RHPLAN_31470 [Rhodoplanes sp. Z2-YC6860]